RPSGRATDRETRSARRREKPGTRDAPLRSGREPPERRPGRTRSPAGGTRDTARSPVSDTPREPGRSSRGRRRRSAGGTAPWPSGRAPEASRRRERKRRARRRRGASTFGAWGPSGLKDHRTPESEPETKGGGRSRPRNEARYLPL